MEAATGDAPPPGELRLAWDVERWGALPDSGGLYDQDYVLLDRMRVLQNVYRTVSKLPNLQGKQIHTLTDSERRLLRWLKDNDLWQKSE